MPTSGGSSSDKHASWRNLPGQSGSSHWSATLLGSLMALLCLALFGVFLWLIVIPFFSSRLATHVVAVTPGEFDNWTVPPILFADEDVQPLAQNDRLSFHGLRGLFDSRMIDSLPGRLQTVVTDPPDVLIVYAIAQGISRDGTGLLLCTDFDPGDFNNHATHLPKSAYPVRQLLNLLGDLDVTAKLLILDCGNLVTEPRLRMVVNEFPYLLSEIVAQQKDHRLWVMCSHSLGEASHPLANQGQSVFGNSVAAGLSGQADADDPAGRDGFVTLWELYRHVAVSCRRSTHGRQTPLLMRGGQSGTSLGEDAQQLCLVESPTPKAPTDGDQEPSPTSDASSEPLRSETKLNQDLLQAWRLRDQLEELEVTNDRWAPIDYAPHLWRRLNARLLDLDLRARGGVAFDKQAVGKVVREYVSGLQSVGRQQPVTEGTDVLRRLAQAVMDVHAAEQAASRDSFHTRSAELNEVGRQVLGYLRALYRAIDQLRWHGQLSFLLAADDPQYVDLTKELGSLLDGLSTFRDQLRTLEDRGLDGPGVSDLRDAWRAVQNAQDALARLVNAEVQSVTEDAPDRADRLRLESLLATPLIRAEQRRLLWDALDNSAPPAARDLSPADVAPSSDPPRLPHRSQLRQHLELHWKLVTLVEPGVPMGDNPLRQCVASLDGSVPDPEVRLTLRAAGNWLGDFSASVPRLIGEAAGSDPARGERLLRLVDARDAMLLPERPGPDSWSFPQLRIQPAQAAPRLTVAWHESPPDLRLSQDWQRIAMTIATGQELKSVSIQVDYDDPRALAIRRPGQEGVLSPGALADVRPDAEGLVAFELRALQLAIGRTGDVPIRFTVRVGSWKEVLPLRCRLPQPNEVELRAECVVPRGPAVSRGLMGVRLQPFPNRATTYRFSLVNLSEEPKDVEVQLLAVERPVDARFGVGRLLDVRGRPYLPPAGKPVAAAKIVSLPADGQPHPLTFDPPPAAPPEGTEDAPASPTPPQTPESAPAPRNVQITHGMICVIRNLKNPQEAWTRWIELRPRLPREYLTVRSNYSEDTDRITVQATLPDVDRDGQPDLVDLPESLQGESAIQMVWATRGQITARATNGRFSGAVPADGSPLELWAEIPPQNQPQTVWIPLEVDKYPRALIHRVTTNRFDRGTDERPRRRHVRVNLLSLGDRRYVTSRSAPEPESKEGQPPPVFLEENQAVAFPVPRLGESEPLTVRFQVDAPFDAFGDPDGQQYDEIHVGWEGERPLTFYSDRQVDIRLVGVETTGQITLETRVNDYTCSLATAGKKGRFILVAGGRVEQREIVPNRVEVRLDHLPPEVLYFQPRSTRVTKGKPIIVDLEVQDLSGISEVKLGLTEQAQDKLPPDATVIPYSGTSVDDRVTLDLSLSTEDDKLSPGTYWIQAELVDQVGYSRKTGSPGFAPQPVRIELPRPAMTPGESSPAEPVKGTVKGYVVFGVLDYRPRDFQVQIKGTSRRTTTANRGAFRFTDVPAGEYVLEASGSLQGKRKKGEATVKLQKPADYTEEVVIQVQ